MIELDGGVAILGSGFGGSLSALIAQRCGLRPILVERGAHPRFALGESSTPMADLVLGELAGRYDLPRLKPFARYGTWLRTYPELGRGLKRGFSYYQHQAGKPFDPREDHANELLVAANADAENGDTHWLRSDFDHFMVREVQSAGVPYLDQTNIDAIEPGERWGLRGRRNGAEVRITAEFVIDATGDGCAMGRASGLDQDTEALHTNSRSVFGHFKNVRLWADVYRDAGGRESDHPFPCDAAALHHVFDGGWMWVLKYDHGVTSAGFSLDRRRYPADPALTPGDEWRHWLRRFPSIFTQFEDAEPVFPVRRIDRVQRRWTRAAGPNWAMLPTTAGIIDALHSTGNAHTLTGIERLMPILTESKPGDVRAARLEAYSTAVLTEVGLIDRLVHGCYASFSHFELMSAYAMLYFAAATFTEAQRRQRASTPSDGFLLSHDSTFNDLVAWAHAGVRDMSRTHVGALKEWHTFRDELARRLGPYNRIGLGDPAKLNMYPFV